MRDVQESSRNFPALVFSVSDVPASVGAQILEARLARRWTQGRLATRAGISRAVVYRLEGGVGGVRADTLFRVAHALDMSIREFVPAWPEWEPIKGVGHGDGARERRRELGLTVAEVAAVIGVSESTLSRFERGIGVSSALLERVGDELYPRDAKLADALLLVDGRGRP